MGHVCPKNWDLAKICHLSRNMAHLSRHPKKKTKRKFILHTKICHLNYTVLLTRLNYIWRFL